jgi:hypothetical protein
MGRHQWHCCPLSPTRPNGYTGQFRGLLGWVGLYRLKFPNSIWTATLRHSCHGSEIDEAIGAPPQRQCRHRAIFASEGADPATFGFPFFRLLGFAVATNLTFCHRNSPLRRLAGCEHCITRSALVSVQTPPASVAADITPLGLMRSR